MPESTLDRKSGRVVRQQVVDHVKGLIRRDGSRCGDRLPSYHQLCADLDVSYVTVKRAMDDLEAEGVVTCVNGRGCFVRRELAAVGRPLKAVGVLHAASYRNLFASPYLRKIMEGIGQEPTGLDVNIFAMRDEGFVTAAQLADRHVDGVLLLGVESEAFLEEFATWNVPGVVVDQHPGRVPLDSVLCDNEAAAREAVRRLAALGHRRVRYVTMDPRRLTQVGLGRTLLMESSDRIERHEAVLRAAAATRGFRLDDLVLAPSSTDNIVLKLVGAWKKDPARPTAILCDDDALSGQLIQTLAAEGVRVPGEVSVCTVASAGPESVEGLRLTGCCFDFSGMGRKAVEVLRARCESPASAPAPKVHRIGFEWAEGSSTREASE